MDSIYVSGFHFLMSSVYISFFFEYSPVEISLQMACVDLISESFLFQDSKFQTALEYIHQP